MQVIRTLKILFKMLKTCVILNKKQFMRGGQLACAEKCTLAFVWCPLTLMMVRSAANPFTLLELTKIVAISAAILFEPCLLGNIQFVCWENHLYRYTSFITLRKTILFLMSAWSGLTWFVVPLALSQPPLIFQPSDGRCGPGNKYCFYWILLHNKIYRS